MEENVRGRQGAVGRVGISAALAMVLLWGEGTEGIVTKGHCICCEMGLKHLKGMIPPKGSGQSRVRWGGYSADAGRNRMPILLGEALAGAMVLARDRRG